MAADVRACVDYLGTADGGRPRATFTVGFCMGGVNSWSQIAKGHGLAGSIGFYGGRPEQILPLIPQMKGELLFLLAGRGLHTRRAVREGRRRGPRRRHPGRVAHLPGSAAQLLRPHLRRAQGRLRRRLAPDARLHEAPDAGGLEACSRPVTPGPSIWPPRTGWSSQSWAATLPRLRGRGKAALGGYGYRRPFRSHEAGQVGHCLSGGLGEPLPRLEDDPVDDERPRSPVEAGIDGADDPVAGEDRHRVVAALSLRLRDVDLDRVVEAEQLAASAGGRRSGCRRARGEPSAAARPRRAAAASRGGGTSRPSIPPPSPAARRRTP